MPSSLQEKGETAKPKFLDQIRTILRIRHYSMRTEEAYLGWIRRFVLFRGRRHPQEMGEAEVAAFLNHLANERTVAKGQAAARASLRGRRPALISPNYQLLINN